MLRIAGLIISCALLLSSYDVSAATIKGVHTGSATITAQNVTVTIPSVDPSKSFLVFSVNCISNRPGQFQIGGELTSATTLFFRRYDASGPVVTIEWQVFEFTSGVNVQRGVISGLTDAGQNIALSAVDISKTFVLTTMHKDGGTYGSDDGFTSDLNSPTNLYIDRQPGGANPQGIYWQVIEYDSCFVQKVTGSLSAGIELTNYAIPVAVNEYKTMIVGGHQISGNVLSSDLPCTELVDTKTFRMARTTTTAQMDFIHYIVEFTDSTRVMHGAVRLLASEAAVTTSIPSVDVSKSGMIAPGNFNRIASNCQASDDHVGYSWIELTLLSSTTITGKRPNSGFAALVPFQVVEFANNIALPYLRSEPGRSTPRDFGLCAAALPIELIAFTAKPSSENVVLNWVTLSESNNDYFSIEHSSNNIDFEVIELVSGAGNSTRELHYESTHLSPTNGNNYYRLKQTDFDGNYSYSDVLVVGWEIAVSDQKIQILPNPNNGQFQVLFPEQFRSAKNDGRIIISDLSGKSVFQKTVAPSERLAISDLRLSKGTYIVSFLSHREIISSRLVIQ